MEQTCRPLCPESTGAASSSRGVIWCVSLLPSCFSISFVASYFVSVVWRSGCCFPGEPPRTGAGCKRRCRCRCCMCVCVSPSGRRLRSIARRRRRPACRHPHRRRQSKRTRLRQVKCFRRLCSCAANAISIWRRLLAEWGRPRGACSASSPPSYSRSSHGHGREEGTAPGDLDASFPCGCSTNDQVYRLDRSLPPPLPPPLP